LHFICRPVYIRVEKTEMAFGRYLRRGQVLRIPIAHGEGNYFIDPQGLAELEAAGQVAFRYCDSTGRVTEESNPNGSLANIAGITNRAGNVLGMMPHPERSAEAILGSEDGRLILAALAKRWEGGLA
ncbi:MAG: phosphoribosylformylglycinamidine synthase subunit PurQ, partial [Bacillota bacterium]|nr:phosphoribosylformylglycinamidine synthase subunit PurQ [Bacillota bacterium]